MSAVVTQGCTSSTTDEWTFSNKEIAENVIAALKEQNVPFEVVNETKIIVPVKFSENVKKELAFADTSTPRMYTLTSKAKKDLYTSRLTANAIPYEEYLTESGNYAVMIDGRYGKEAQELYAKTNSKQ